MRAGCAVATLRKCPTAEAAQLDTRVGKDGRYRPIGPEKQRAEIVECLSANPTLSLRRVAQLVHASPSTVSNVKRQIATTVTEASRKELARSAKCGGDNAGPEHAVANSGKSGAMIGALTDRGCDEWLGSRSTDLAEWSESIIEVPPNTISIWAGYARAQAERWTRAALFFESRH
jgi:hypothetical protein